MMELLEFLFRWLHVLFGIVWVGLLFFFNFIQGEFLKEASADAKQEVIKKLLPRSLWWFRWAAVYTLLTGCYLLYSLGASANQFIVLAAVMGFVMFLNVWLVIWPKQKVVCGLVSGDSAAAAAVALLASRTNTLLSAPMLFGMLASKHGYASGGHETVSAIDVGFVICLLIVAVIELNGLFGRLYWLATVKGVIGLSVALTALLYSILHYL